MPIRLRLLTLNSFLVRDKLVWLKPSRPILEGLATITSVDRPNTAPRLVSTAPLTRTERAGPATNKAVSRICYS